MNSALRNRHGSGFTLLELLVVIGILAALAGFVLLQLSGNYERTWYSRARGEMTQIAQAAHQYIIEHGGDLPADVDRALPSGVEAFLGEGTWPDAPWPGSVYDWDVFPDKTYGPNYQISIRFCPLGQPSKCKFPNEPWAASFDYYSSMYFCIRGVCKAHPDKPQNHPGYCVNCGAGG